MLQVLLLERERVLFLSTSNKSHRILMANLKIFFNKGRTLAVFRQIFFVVLEGGGEVKRQHFLCSGLLKDWFDNGHLVAHVCFGCTQNNEHCCGHFWVIESPVLLNTRVIKICFWASLDLSDFEIVFWLVCLHSTKPEETDVIRWDSSLTDKWLGLLSRQYNVIKGADYVLSERLRD